MTVVYQVSSSVRPNLKTSVLYIIPCTIYNECHLQQYLLAPHLRKIRRFCTKKAIPCHQHGKQLGSWVAGVEVVNSKVTLLALLPGCGTVVVTAEVYKTHHLYFKRYILLNTTITCNKKFLNKYPERAYQSSKGKYKSNKEPCPRSLLTQTTFSVCITGHLASRHSIDPKVRGVSVSVCVWGGGGVGGTVE